MEEKLLHRIIDHLSSNRPIRDLKLDGEPAKMIRGFQFLTQKPIMIIVNSDENNFGKNENLLQEIGKNHRVIEFAGKFEMELSQLNDQGDEVRAWSLQAGQNVIAAAGTIHTDLARGFIQAECISYDDLMLYGSEKQVSERGLRRLEGKKYIVQDGNVLNIRFNV
jgi:ribosome-binding ATPase YchF (GTP1/OBG family)